MSNVLDHLIERRRREAVLVSGLKVGFHLPDVQECILAGQLPIAPLLNQPPDGPVDVSTEQARIGHDFKQRLVAMMIDDIDGDPITPEDDRAAIAAALEPQDRDELFRIANERPDQVGEA